MFCIVFENKSIKRKQLICCENEKYKYFLMFCKKFTSRIRKRISQKLACPIVFADNIDSTALKEKIIENIAVYYLKKYSGKSIAIVGCHNPSQIISRVIPYSKEIHLVNCGDINENDYLNRFGYAPAKFDNITNEEVALRYNPSNLYINFVKINLPDSDYLIPLEVAEISLENFPELDFLYLMWKYENYNIDNILPVNVINL